MPRKTTIRTTEFPYHLTGRVNNREPFPGELEYAWKIFAGELLLQSHLQGTLFHAFVLMPNHFHLLATSPHQNIDHLMRNILSPTTRIINTRRRRTGRIFGARYYWSVIREPAYFAHALKYVYRNPVKANLCENVADYPFSTYTGLVGGVHLPIPILPPPAPLARFIPGEAEELDTWLNTPYRKEENDAIRWALRQEEFQYSVDRKRRRVIIPAD